MLKSSHRMAKRFCSSALALLLLVPGSLLASAEETDSTDGAAGISNTGTQGEYFQYLSESGGKAYAGDDILLPLEQAALSDAVAAVSHLEKDALKFGTDGTAQWTVSVPENGLYCISLAYVNQRGNRKDGEIAFLLDGKSPYSQSEEIELGRVWKDATGILQDGRGNDLIPEQEEVSQWSTVRLQDYALFTNTPLQIYLTAGEHTLTLKNTGETLYIRDVRLTGTESVATVEQATAAYAGKGYTEAEIGGEGYLKYQAEETALKSSQSIYPQYDRTSPATEPYHVSKIRRNVIGQGNWSAPGQWISYKIKGIPEDGLYYITLKYRQNLMTGQSSFRSIYVNGEIPSTAYENVAFPYGVNWDTMTIVDENGNPCPVYLKAGDDNEIRMEVPIGKWAEVLQSVEDINRQLNNLYIEMVMITGTSPDKYRDYNLDDEIPGLIESLTSLRDQLVEAADRYDELSGSKSTQSETIRRAADQIGSMLANRSTIPQRITNFRDTISSLSSWVYGSLEQPLELDYILVHEKDAELPAPKASFWASLKHFVGSFIASFTEDYNSIGDEVESKESISVWMNSGRDQVQILKDMITDEFTVKTGIPVNLSLVQTGFVEATLAGAGPDVFIGIPRGQPVNLACRGALADLSGFDTYKDVMARFSDTAAVPYTFNDGVYAVPNTQTFFMMFYRTDIFNRLGLSVPQTWDDVFKLIPRLQQKHMAFGLPYTVISAATAVDNGMGAKDLFPALLLQNGGSFYSADSTHTNFDSTAAMDAFKTWTDFYTQYGFDLVIDFYTRFRNGEIPVGIASYDVYNTLTAGAPEIRGQWEMAPIPGVQKENGEIDRSSGGAGTAVVMFSKAENPESCWDFIDWWTTEDVQYRYSNTVENIIGPGGRQCTANIEAFKKLSWSTEEAEALEAQRKYLQEIQEIPGSYYVSRSLDNAFRSVLYDDTNPREAFERENENINREIARKRQELGLD